MKSGCNSTSKQPRGAPSEAAAKAMQILVGLGAAAGSRDSGDVRVSE